MSSAELLILCLAVAGAVFLVASYVFFTRMQRAEARAVKAEIELARAEGLSTEIARITRDIEAYRQREEEWRETSHAADTQARVLEEKLRALEAQKKNAETILEEMKQSARASVMQSGAELSSKLLDDHKREREEGHKQLDVLLGAVREQLQNLQGKTATLDAMQQRLGAELQTMSQALAHPISAGAHAEIGFENLLTNLGLTSGQDFFLQYAFVSEEGKSMRPDCVILLPQETALVVDCKASPYVLELAKAEGTEGYDAVLDKFAASMQTHLKTLATKQYADAIQKVLKAETKKPVSRIFNVMYCPSEAALERVLAHDTSLRERAIQGNIMLAGPVSLPSLFGLAKLQIAQAQQAENQQQILQLLSQWMSDVMAALKHAEKIGGAIRTAMGAYDAMAGAVNRNVVGRMQRLVSLGVEPAKAGSIQKLPRFSIERADDVIAGEAEELAVLALEDKDAA